MTVPSSMPPSLDFQEIRNVVNWKYRSQRIAGIYDLAVRLAVCTMMKTMRK